MTTHAVELINISKQFVDPQGATITAVRDLSVEIRAGEFFSLLGASGCGKTTTLRMVAGFEMPTQGEIRIHGDIMGDTPAYQRRVNTVFQNYALFPHMTVFDNVAFGLEMEKLPKADIRGRVQKALALVQLPGLERRKPRQLSGGQQQRVALARALVKQPRVLLLDEPLGALDLKLRKAMQLELKHIQTQVGITFIYVTHDQEEALTMSDRIAVMSEGQILQLGSPSDIYEKPSSRFVADFIGETNLLDGHVVELADQAVQIAVDEDLTLTALRGQADLDLQAGQAVTFALRPEKILIQAEAPANQAAIPGQIEQAVYIGTDMRYTVQISPKNTLVARLQNLGQSNTHRFQRGDHVYVSWHAETVQILRS